MYLQPDAWKIGLSSVTMTGFPGIVLAGSACEERMLRYREGNASMLPAIPRIRTLEIAFHTLADTLLFICETIISCNEQDWGRNLPPSRGPATEPHISAASGRCSWGRRSLRHSSCCRDSWYRPTWSWLISWTSLTSAGPPTCCRDSFCHFSWHLRTSEWPGCCPASCCPERTRSAMWPADTLWLNSLTISSLLFPILLRQVYSWRAGRMRDSG